MSKKASKQKAVVASVKKKPSKVDLKKVIAAMKKDDVDATTVRVALKYLPHYLKSTGLTKKLLKEIIRLWSASSEKIRVLALLSLVRIYTRLKDKQLKEVIVKKLYSTFLDKCRVTKLETMSMIGFMRHSLIELYKLDSEIALKQANTAIGQLTTTMKNAKIHKNQETQKTVLNWQFTNRLILLSTFITSVQRDNKLTNQVIQLNLDAINIIVSPRYYGFYIHLIENLIAISSSTELFIPILPIIVGLIERIDIPRDDLETLPDDSQLGYDMNLLNHVSSDEAHKINYKLAVLNKLHEMLIRYLASQSHRIAFPELTILPCVQLKKWFRKNHNPKTQQFKLLLDKIKVDCSVVEERRKSIDFAFNDFAAVDAWEKKMKDSNKLALPKLASTLTDNDNSD